MPPVVVAQWRHSRDTAAHLLHMHMRMHMHACARTHTHVHAHAHARTHGSGGGCITCNLKHKDSGDGYYSISDSPQLTFHLIPPCLIPTHVSPTRPRPLLHLSSTYTHFPDHPTHLTHLISLTCTAAIMKLPNTTEPR
jgi:hypothetical protein